MTAALAEAMEAGIVEEREVLLDGRHVPGHGFRHPLVRLACAERLTGAVRAGLHAAYADAVLRHRPEAVDAAAYHLTRARDARAVPFLWRAARRAQALYANESAAGYYADLVALLGGGEEAARARLAWGDALRSIGRYGEAERALTEALTAFRTLQSAEATGRATATANSQAVGRATVTANSQAADRVTAAVARLAEVLVGAGRPAEARELLAAQPAAGHPTPTFDQPVAFPSRVDDYRTAGVWNDRIRVEGRMALTAAQHEFGPRKDNHLVWNAGVIGPTMVTDGLARLGDEMGLNSSYGIQWFIDTQAGATGTDWGATGTLDLERDGKLLKSWSPVGLWQPVAAVPAGTGVYTLRGTVLRERPYAGLSTRVDTEWTFESDTTEEITILPLMAVRAEAHGLDLSNRARTGQQTRLTVAVERSPGAAPSPASLRSLEVSFDDGATWRPVTVKHGTAKIHNPRDGAFVSLRAKAADEQGATVTQTIIRAYGLR